MTRENVTFAVSFVALYNKMGKTKKKNLRNSGIDKPYPNLADQIVGDRIVSKKNKEPKIRLRQDESEEVIFLL